jgi:Na+(H+)/acetate symporter ActP
MHVPMQFFILLTGVMVYVFFQFNTVPLNFNPTSEKAILKSEYAEEFKKLEASLNEIRAEKQLVTQDYVTHLNANIDNEALVERIKTLNEDEKNIREQAKDLIKSINEEPNDKDYVFIYFILNYLPKGLVGLLLAVILSAAMSSTASELNALSSTTTMDFYKSKHTIQKTDKHYLNVSKGLTLAWGIIAILFATFGTLVENLIQLVNIIGSIFYGTVLGIFLVAFYMKFISAKAIFSAAVISQLLIFYIFWIDLVSFLWLNFIGAVLTILLSCLFQTFISKKSQKEILS